MVDKMNDTVKVYSGFIILMPINGDEEEKHYREILKNYKMLGTCKVQKFYELDSNKKEQRFLKFTFFVASDALLFKLTYAGKPGVLL
jgi:hypothetical protein